MSTIQRVRAPALQDMSDEIIMRHLEHRHAKDLALEFRVLPGQTERRLEARSTWIAYHDALHRLALHGEYKDHYHRRPGEGNE